MKTTKVLFLTYKDADFNEDLFAYFPEEAYNDDPKLKSCYAHVGQHSACHVDYAKECKEAVYNNYTDLKKELDGIGYKLQVLNKDFERQDAISKGKVWTIRWSDCEDSFFEGTKTACHKFIKANHYSHAYKKGSIRLGKVIYEPSKEISC